MARSSITELRFHLSASRGERQTDRQVGRRRERLSVSHTRRRDVWTEERMSCPTVQPGEDSETAAAAVVVVVVQPTSKLQKRRQRESKRERERGSEGEEERGRVSPALIYPPSPATTFLFSQLRPCLRKCTCSDVGWSVRRRTGGGRLDLLFFSCCCILA